MENFDLLKMFFEYFPLKFEFLKEMLPEQYSIYIDFLPIFIAAMLLSFVITPIIGFIAKKFKIIDEPCQTRECKSNKDDDPTRHTHKRSTPLLGGLAFLIPVVITLGFFANISHEIQAILIGVLILTIMGILDDIFNLPAIYQLTGQILAAGVICISPIALSSLNIPFVGVINLNLFESSFSLLGYPLLLTFPGDLLMMAWILVCINAIKFVNGSDALMEGNAIVICLLFFILGIRTDAEIIVILSLVLAGGITGFLFYNFPPAKIFSGSAGKTTLGFLIAVIAILNDTKFAASIMILTLPMIDFFFVVIRRYLIHKPKKLLELIRINDQSHLHHQLIKLGLGPKRIVLLESSITLAVGSIAILTTGAMNFFFFILAVLIVTLTVFLIHTIGNTRKKDDDEPQSPPDEGSPESRYSY